MKKKFILITTAVVMLILSIYFLKPSEVKNNKIDYNKYHDMLEYFSSEERSLGHPNHDAMRDYLVEELSNRGLDVELINNSQSETLYDDEYKVFEGDVSNILAKLPANNPGSNPKTIAFISHYDSVAGSYGAGDAGLAVISFFAGLDSILEKERVNDIVILITDHEELGLIGAKYIADYRPNILKEIDFLYNWESRGTGGNVILFETSKNDYEGVKNYIDVVDQQFTASFATAVYENMPNGSDFTIFKEAGNKGINFAMIEQFADYHTSRDHIDNIPMSTFNYYVNNVEQLMVDSATKQFNIKPTKRSIYFNYFDHSIIFSSTAVSALLVLSILGYAFIIYKTKGIVFKKVIFAIIFVVIAFIIANLLSLIPVSIFGKFSEFKPPQETTKIRFTLIYNNFYAIFMYIVLLLSMFGLSKLFEKKQLTDRNSLFIVVISLLMLLQTAVFFILYGALPIFTIPLLVLECCYIARMYLKHELIYLIVLLILIPILYPVVYYIYIALTVNSFIILINVLVIFTLYFSFLHLKEVE